MSNRSFIHGVIVLVGLILGGALIYTQTAPSNPHETPTNVKHSTREPTEPAEPGQAAFAAIQEVVRILENQENTDWSEANIDELRKHLVDMHELTLNSTVVRKPLEDGMTFEVSGTGRTVGAIRRMVPRHAKMTLGQMKQWQARTEPTETGVKLIVKSNDNATVEKIRALGFFGIMAKGANHPKHHLMIGRGTMEYSQ